MHVEPSVPWHCWLGSRKGIQPVKKQWWGAGVVICLERDADLHMAQPMPLSLASVKSRLVLPFWYRLTWVVADKNGGVGMNACICCLRFSFFHTKPRDCLGETSQKRPILCRVVRKTITQLISQSVPAWHPLHSVLVQSQNLLSRTWRSQCDTAGALANDAVTSLAFHTAR